MPLPTARPGDAPPRVNLSDFAGCVVLLGIAGLHERMQTANGTKDGLRCFMMPLSGNSANQIFGDSILFSTRVVGRLRGIAAGTIVFGLVTQGSGRNAPVDFEPLNAEWEAYAVSKVNEMDAALTVAIGQEIEAYHRFEVERKDSRGNSVYAMTSPPATSSPTVPNNPPPMGSQTNGGATTPVPPPSGMPTGSPAAGPSMPALPSATLASLMTPPAGQSEEPPF